MSDALNLPAEARERAGKGASRAIRREGRTPAVIYGGKEEPTLIHVEEKELVKQLMTGHFTNAVVNITIGGKTIRTLPKDVAFHPVSDRPIHVDFLRVTGATKVEVLVPVVSADANEIAPGSVRRLEVLRDGASAIYGADAVAGVVNTVLRGNRKGGFIEGGRSWDVV